jgi:hypothetical protein
MRRSKKKKKKKNYTNKNFLYIMSSQYLKRSRVDFENQDYSSQEVKVQQTINWDDEVNNDD